MKLKNIIACLLAFQISLFACADGFDYGTLKFNFLSPRTTPFANISKDIKSVSVYNSIDWFYDKINKEENLKEWQNFLKSKKQNLSTKELEKIIYQKQNIEKIKDKDIVKYLNFVQKQEQYVKQYYYWDKPKKVDISPYIKEALRNLENTKSKWLKLRYFFLAFRLAHYKGKNPLELYKKYTYLLKNEGQDIVKNWIQGIYSGALVKNKQTVKGVYEFTKLFDKNHINWHLSYYNFYHINTNELWEDLLSLAKNDEEKTKMYALRSLDTNSNKLEEIQNIYNIDKNSKYFDFVLYRYLFDTQHFFDSYDTYEYDYVLGEKKVFSFKPYIKYLKSIKKDDMYMIDLSLAYLHLYEKDYKGANIYKEKLEKNYANSLEVQIFSYILYLNKLKSIDKQIEDNIYTKLEKILKQKETKKESKYPIFIQNNYDYNPSNIKTNIKNYTFVIAKKLYEKKGDNFKAFLCNHINYLAYEEFTLNSLVNFENFMKSPTSSKFMAYIKEQYKENTTSTSFKDLKTKLLINNLKFKEALDLDANILNTKIKFNPFNTFIKGNNRKGKKFTKTIKEFLQTILVIQENLKKNPNSLSDNYLLANVLYNLSYFGNSNILTTVYRSNYSFSSKEKENEKLNLAKKYYEKVLKNSKDREIKAKINYILAKVELALYDVKFAIKDKYRKNSYEFSRNWDSKETYEKYVKSKYGKYFDELEKKYSDTKYYQEVLNECANLKYYQKLKGE